jgi:ABC-type multidrug transport system permease subunit
MLQNVAVYPNEKDVFYRENDDGTYGVEAFLAQYITLEVPFEIATSFLFAILVDLGAGLPRTAQMFFVCFFNCFCIVSCGESLGIMVSHSPEPHSKKPI